MSTEMQKLYKWRWEKKNPDNHRISMNRYMGKIREWLRHYKISRGCIDCGFNEHPAALGFDHVAGNKKAKVSSLRGMLAVKAEVEKCVVRCHNCHAIRHARDRKEALE